MSLEKLDFKNIKRCLGKIFGRILKAYDVKHHMSQSQTDWMILKAPKREMKTPLFYHFKKPNVFISHLGAFKIIESGWLQLIRCFTSLAFRICKKIA
jgi:hypothetical protein